MSQEYQHKNTSVFLLNYHFIWIPKRRRKVLTGQIAERLKKLLYEVVNTIDSQITALEIMPDHVHLFLSANPKLAPDQIMFRIKGYTSRILRQEFPNPLMRMPSMWTRSYFISTAGNVASSTIEKYIQQQKTRD